MFIPPVLHPEPPPWFKRELKLIDPTLRVSFGYERYLLNKWVIERKMSAERYWTCYASLFEQNIPRYTQQPIFDVNHPLYDEEGGMCGYEQVGVREYDLAPEWEWIMTIETKAGQFKQPGPDDLTELRRLYAWNFTHPLSRAKFEAEEAAKVAAKERAQKEKRLDLWHESIEEAWSEFGLRNSFAAQPETAMSGTEL